MELSYKKIKTVFKSGGNRFSVFFGYAGLLTGVMLLLLCLQLFFDIQKALSTSPSAGGFDYISISKAITNENMGSENNFTLQEIEQMKQQKDVAAVSPLQTNQFYVRASAGSTIPFSTDLFLESVDASFIDTVPPSFQWQQGQTTIPVIFSSDFLEMYNVFAPAQGLPQISPETLKAVNLQLECSGPGGSATFQANVVALSDRVNSILVPESFLNWSNQYFAGVEYAKPSRVYLRVRDANNPQFIDWLQNHGYHLNTEKYKYGKLKGILQNIVGALAVLGCVVLLLALLLLSFVIQLNIAKSRENLVLLHTLGYNKKWLSRNMAKTWMPVYLIIVLIALILVQLAHFAFVKMAAIARVDIILHWSIFLIAVAFPVIILGLITSLIKRELNRIL